MRVLLASYYYPPSIGGLERQSHLLARELVRRGHEVHVVTARLDGFVATETRDGVSIERVSPGRGSRWTRMATYLAGMLAAVHRRRSRTDVVQVQQALYPAAAMALACRAWRRPLVVRNSGSGPEGAVRLMSGLPGGPTALRLIRWHATTISLSHDMSRELRSVGFDRIEEIPNGVEVPPVIGEEERRASRAKLGLEGPVVLYVGRVEPQKGVRALLRAWPRVTTPEAHLLIVGDGAERASLEREAMQHPSGRRVRFTGATDEVRRHIAAADLFALASPGEGISNALLEAMAAGLPVVASDVGGNRQVVGDPSVGALVAAERPDELAAAIDALLSDERRARAMGAAARQHVVRNFSVDHMVASYERLYARLLRGRP